MKVKIRKKYLKTNRAWQSPIKFRATQPKGENTDVHALIIMQPVLKKHPDLRKPMIRHEVDEIKHWGEGSCCHHAHKHAKSREPKLTRNMSVNSFWSEIKRRKHGKNA